MKAEEPEIHAFSSSSSTIRRGESAELSWQTQKAVRVGIVESSVTADVLVALIEQQELVDSGTFTVTPERSVSYVLQAKNIDGVAVTESLTITVQPGDPPSIERFDVMPAIIASGESSVLVWETSRALELELMAGEELLDIVDLSPSDSMTVSPGETTTFVLKAKNFDGETEANSTLTVVADPPQIDLFAAQPAVVSVGEDVELSWEVSGVTSNIVLRVNDVELMTSALEPTDSISLVPETTTTYTLAVSNPAGEDTADVVVTVVFEPVIVSFTADPLTIASGGSSTLSWETEGADQIAITSAEGESLDVSDADPEQGSVDVSPSVTTTFTLEVRNLAGTASTSVVVTVAP